MSNASDALQAYHNRPSDDPLHGLPDEVPAFCKHLNLEPLYRIARPYPKPATKTAYATTLIATVCLGCHMLRWVTVDELES